MGLILCDQHNIKTPLYIEDLGIHIFSLEELCYVIFNFPYISLDGLVNDNFHSFINEELSIPVHGDNNDEILISILNFSDYYSSQDVEKFRLQIYEIRRLSRCEFCINKGDFLFNKRKFGKAKCMYDSALIEASYQNTDSSVYGQIYRSIGAAAANMFDYDAAYDAYSKAYSFFQDESILKNIYFLSKQQPVIGKREKYLKYLNDRVNPDWDLEYENAFSESYSNKSIEDFDSSLMVDSVKKKKALAESVLKIKQDYRSMI